VTTLRKAVDKLKDQFIEETHGHIFCIPKSKKELNQILKKYENDNVTVEILKIYDW
jgi:arsenate reductase-like glutaredoxin family protein